MHKLKIVTHKRNDCEIQRVEYSFFCVVFRVEYSKAKSIVKLIFNCFVLLEEYFMTRT